MYKVKVAVCVKFKGSPIQAAADATRCDGKTSIVSDGINRSAIALMVYDQRENRFLFFRSDRSQLPFMVKLIGNDGLEVIEGWGPTWQGVSNLPVWSLE